MSLISNASPQVILYGTDDQSKRTIYPESPDIPQHLPLFYIYAKKGKTDRMLLTASQMTELYGDETFEVNDKWFNHQTRFLSAVQGQANNCMVQRLIPKDAGAKSNAAVFADIIETTVPNYLRYADGGYVTDAETGEKIVDSSNPTVDGYVIKFVKEYYTEDMDAGTLKTKTGTMTITTTEASEEVTSYATLRIDSAPSKIHVNDVVALNITTDADNYTVTSANAAVIEITEDGELKGIAEGSIAITVTAEKAGCEPVSIEHSVTVVAENATILDAAQLEMVGVVEKFTQDLSETTITNAYTDVAIEITSSNAAVATVEGTTITGVGAGYTVIRVKAPYSSTYETNNSYFVLQYDTAEYTTTTSNSIMYPLFEMRAKYQGEYYNNIGWTISSLTNDSVDSKIVSELKALPYALSLYTRESDASSATSYRSLYGEPSVNFVFKEKAINPNTDARMDFEYVYENNWFNETDSLKALKYEDYEDFYLYRDNLETILKKFLEKEKPFITSEETTWEDNEDSSTLTWFDFTTDDEEELDEEFYLLNPFSCMSSNSVNYFTLHKVDTTDSEYDNIVHNYTDTQSEVIFSTEAPIFLSGGNDGTFSNEAFEELVIEKMNDYSDTDSEVHDLAVNVESIFYDSGFTLDTKKQLVQFITNRKDTALILSTHDASLGESYLGLSDSRAIGEALKTRCQLAPESDYFGTPVCRAMIMLGSGLLRDGTTDRVPFTYEIAIKAAKMMGAANGNWKPGELFDAYPNSILSYLTDPQPSFIPAGIKPTLWDTGLVWCQPYDRASFFFPALQTVYDDDTSVLNSFFNMMAIGQLSKLGDKAWRRFSGTTTKTNAEFKEAVCNYMKDSLKDKFGGLLTVIPVCNITDQDENRGYSWTMVWKLYAGTMKTVGISYTQAFRSEDLE